MTDGVNVPAKTAKCEDCGKRVQTSLGSDPRYPQGIRTTSGTYICGPCMGKRHAPTHVCGWCGGEGAVRDNDGRLAEDCPRCHGRTMLAGAAAHAANEEAKRLERDES